MKKSLALLLAVLMLVTMFPVSVFAAGDEGDENVVVITEANGVEEGASTIDNEDHPYILVITLASGISMTETSDAGIAEALGDAYSYADSLAMMGAGDASAAKYELILNEDVTLEKMMAIPAGRDVVIDLNGHNITSGYQEGSDSKHIYPFDVYGDLTIKDSVGGGSISGRGIYVRDGATLTLESGTVYGIDANGGSALYQYGGDIVINGGTVEQTADYTYNYAINAGGGTVTINGGQVVGKHGALAIVGAAVKLTGGELICVGNEGWTDNVVYVSSGSFEATGGSVTHKGQDVKSDSGAAVVAAGDDVAITISGGSFTGLNGALSGNANTIVTGGTFVHGAYGSNHYSDVSAYVPEGFEYDAETGTVVEKTVSAPTGVLGTVYVQAANTDKNTSDRNRLYGEVTGIANAKESLVIKTYSGETLLATTALAKLEYLSNTTLGVNIVISGSTSSSWNTVWEDGMPRADLVPDKAVLYIDGVEMNTADVTLDIIDNLGAPTAWETLPGINPAPANYVAMIGEQGYATLAEALAAAQSGDTIVLLSDIVMTEDAAYALNFTRKAVNIDGNGHKITQAADCDIDWALLYFQETGATVTIKDLTFDGIRGGAAIWAIDADIIVDNCVFQNGNYTQKQGVIRMTSGSATVQDSKFLNNECNMAITFNFDLESSVVSDDVLTVKGCEFSGNTGADTALIYYVKGNGSVIEDNKFTGNTVSTASHGAIIYYSEGANCTVTGNEFSNNTITAGSARAGVLALEAGTVASENAFVNNTVSSTASGTTYVATVLNKADSDSQGVTVDGNFWDGGEPDCVSVKGAPTTAQTYYTTYEDGVLGGLRKIGLNGSGTETNPYQIGTAEELFLFAEKVNDGTYKNVYVVLTADIDLEQEDWISIGTSSNPFTGTFDGKGYTISNLWCYERGLFGYTSTGNYVDFGKTGRATIKNLTLNGVEVYNQSNSAVGGLVGQAGQNTEISAVTVTGYISIYGYGYVGGLVGQGYVHVDNCHVIGVDDEQNSKSTIDANYWAVGGIVGHAGSEGGASITNCSVENVNIQSAIYGAGAIAGVGTKGPIENVSAKDVSIGAESTPDANGLLVGCNYKQITGDCHVENVVLTVADTVVASPQDMAAKIGDKFYAAFASAVAAAQNGDKIVVLNDLTLTNGVEVAAGKTITLDLNGKTITGTPTETKAYSVITNKGNLTITGDGAIVCDHKLTGSTGYAVNTIVNSGTLTIDGATIENKSTATNQIGYAIDNNSTSTDAILVVKSGDVKVSGSYYYDGVRLFCNNLTKENSVTVEGGSVSSIWMQNPSDGATEKDTKEVKGSVSISGGTVGALYLEPSTAFDAAITGGNIGKVEYFATAEGRDVTGFISGGIFNAPVAEEFCAEGYILVDNGDGTYGVVVASSGNVAYRGYINNSADRKAIQIDLEKVLARESLVIKLYDENGNLLTTTTYRAGAVSADALTVNIVLDGRESGSWATEIHSELSIANVPATIEVIVDGKVTDTYENALGDKYGEYKALDCVYKAAQIGNAYYMTFAEALNAAQSGETVVLLRDVKLADTLAIEKSITLDGNGHKITLAARATVNSAVMAGNSGWGDDHGESITLKNIVFENWNTNYGVIRAQGVTLTVDNCDFNNCSVSSYAYGVVSLNYTDATITNSAFTNNTAKAIDINYNADDSNAVVTIDGCEFIGNTTDQAGIVFRNDGTMYLSNSTFKDNTVNTTGNAATVYVGFGTGSSVVGCSFEDNTVTTSHVTTKRLASAIFCDGTVVKNNVFGENTATRNGETITTAVAVGAYYGDADISGNYWGGNAPVPGVDYTIEYTKSDVAIEDYYADAEQNDLKPITYVAKVGKYSYATLQDAINAAAEGDTITLLDSITLEKTAVVADKAITLDLAGHVISGNCNANQQALVCVENNAELMLKDSVGGGKVAFAQGTSNVGWAIDVKGKFVLESGIIELTGNWSIGYAVEVRPNSWGTEYTEGSIFVMNGGSIVSSDGGVRVASSSAEGHKNVSASFEMNGGSIDAAWDGVFIQQSDAIYDDLSFVMNGGTIESDLNPVRVYGPAPTGYVNDSNCMSITLAGGTMTYTGTEAQTWVIAGILRVGGGSSTATILENGSLTVSAEIAQSAAAPEGFKWVETTTGYTLAECEYVAQIGEKKYESLAEAFKVGGDIVLLKDVEITSTITLAEGKTATLDLNGKTIDGMGNVRIALMSYGDLTLKDSSAEQTGVIKAGIGTAGNAVNICAGSFTMESGSIYSLNNGILIDEKAATVTIKGGKITAEPATNNSAVFYISSTSDTVLNIEGGELVGYNGILLWNNTEINITGGTITAEGRLGIQGNGSKDNTKINISGGTLTGKEAAIYHPQGGDLNISGDAVLTGNTGIIVKGGNVTISGGTIRAIGAAGVYEPVSSGFKSTGDGLYVEHFDNSINSENYGTPVVTVTGGTITSVNGQPVGSYANTNNNVEALAGFISGGIFNKPVAEELCAEGYIPVANGDGTYGVAEASYVAQIGETKYESLAAAVAAAQDGDTITILAGEISDGTIKLPATWKNITIKGAEGKTSILKDMVIMSADGNAVSYEGITIDGIVFDNSYIVMTGWRTNGATYKDWTITNCEFKNINNASNTAAVHFNMAAHEAVQNFTFTNNIIDGALGGSKSGLYLQATGNVTVKDNTINNVAFRPYVIQLTTDDGIADNFTVTGNTFSGTAAGRAQGLGNNAAGTDSVTLVVTGNIFKDITASQQICYWNFNPETTTADLSKNYYDIDILANPTKIYFNGSAQNAADLMDMGVFPYYADEAKTELVTAPAIMVTYPVGNPVYPDGKIEYYNDMLEAVPYTTNCPRLEGATITLLKDTSGAGMRFMENDMVFDLNGHTYTITAGTGSQGSNTSGFQIRPEVTTSAIFKNGTIKVAEGAPVVWMFNVYATDFIVEDVTIDCTNMAWGYGSSCYVVVSRAGDNVQFVGNTKIENFNASVAGYAIKVGGTMIIGENVTGLGTIELDAGAELTAKEGLNVITADGYKVVYADGKYTSVEIVYVAEVADQKFETVQEALRYAIENNASKLKILTDVREQMINDFELVIDSDLTITADNPVKVEFFNQGTNYDFVVGSNNNNTLTIDENVHFDLTDRVIWLGYFGNNVDVVVEGYLGGYQIWHGADTTVTATGTLDSHGEAFIMRRDATLTVNGGKVHANYFQIYSGHIVAKDATIDAGLVWVNNNHNYGSEGTVSFDLDNTTFNINGEVKVNVGADKTAPITLTNGSAVTARGALTLGEGASIKADASSSFTVKGKSVFVAEVNGWKYTSLADAIAAAQDGETVTLLTDVALTESLVVTGKLTLDLNGKTLTSDTDTVSVTDANTELTIQNGTITSTGNYCGAVYVKNGKVSLKDCTLMGLNEVEAYAVYASSNSTLTIENCNLIAKDFALIMLNANVTVNSGDLEAAVAISANGSAVYDGAELTINGGTLTGSDCAIYWPTNGKLTINGGKLTGKTAVYMKSGSLEITGGELIGNGAAADYVYTESGVTETGDALVIENVAVGEYDAIGTVNITGGTFTSENAKAVASYAATSQNPDVTAVSKFISGGIFNTPVAEEYCAEGYIPVDNGDGTYGVAEASYVAQIGETKYESLQAAIDVAENGDVITLLSAATGVTVPEGKTVILDLAGFDIVGTTNAITNNGTLTINDSVGTGNVYTTDVAAQGRAAVVNNGTLVINGGWFGDSNNDTTDRNAHNRGNALKNYGTATINGGYFTNVSNQYIGTDAYAYAINNLSGGQITINNATVYGDINGLIYADGEVVVNDGSFTLGRPNEENNLWYLAYGNVQIKGGTWTRAFKVPTWNTGDPKFSGNVEVSGGTFNVSVPEEFCADGFVALPDMNGNFVAGAKPTATVNNLGMMTVPAGDYMVYGSGSNTEDMPLSFVMQFLADQDAEDMENSPFAEWYGDFVITFTGIENGSFTADGCYLAGHYGSFGWVKVPVDGMTIEEGIRYPVMLGVGMGQKYDYICSGVQDFKCALYLTPEILAANPDIEVKLELGVVDNSQGEDAAADALVNNENVYSVTDYTYTAEDFVVKNYVAEVGGEKFESLQEALNAAQAGETVKLLADASTEEVITIMKNITLDLNGCKLTAGGLAFFGYGAIVDNGEKTGLLAVPYRFLMMNNASYPMLPVWNEAGTGYVFTTVNPQASVVSVDEDSFYVNFRPSISRDGVSTLEWFANGAADHGISFEIKIHCFKNGKDVETFDFKVEDEFIKTVYTNASSFKLNVNGATTMFDEYKVEIIVASDTNIAYSTICSTTFIPSTANAQ